MTEVTLASAFKGQQIRHVERILAALSDEAEHFEHDWEFFARPDQLAPTRQNARRAELDQKCLIIT